MSGEFEYPRTGVKIAPNQFLFRFPRVPARSRRSDPITSHLAAERLNGSGVLSELEREVYAYLLTRQDGATDEEIEMALDPERERFAPTTIRGRRGALANKWKIIVSDGTRENRRGISMLIWKVKTATVKL